MQLPPPGTPNPGFYTKRTPSYTYLRRTRKVFTRGNAVCNIRPDIYKRAQYLTPSHERMYARTHVYTRACTQFLPPWPPENKQNRTLSTNSNSRKGWEGGGGRNEDRADSFLAISSFSLLFVRLSKTFRRTLQNTARHGSAIRCQNKKFDSRDREREREKESPSLAR